MLMLTHNKFLDQENKWRECNFI